VYHPPGSDDKALLAHLTESIDSVLSTNPGAGIILAGDFNQFPFFGFFRLDHSGTEEGHNATPDKHIPQLVEYVCNR
jgi:hypothetical protein